MLTDDEGAELATKVANQCIELIDHNPRDVQGSIITSIVIVWLTSFPAPMREDILRFLNKTVREELKSPDAYHLVPPQ